MIAKAFTDGALSIEIPKASDPVRNQPLTSLGTARCMRSSRSVPHSREGPHASGQRVGGEGFTKNARRARSPFGSITPALFCMRRGTYSIESGHRFFERSRSSLYAEGFQWSDRAAAESSVA